MSSLCEVVKRGRGAGGQGGAGGRGAGGLYPSPPPNGNFGGLCPLSTFLVAVPSSDYFSEHLEELQMVLLWN